MLLVIQVLSLQHHALSHVNTFRAPRVLPISSARFNILQYCDSYASHGCRSFAESWQSSTSAYRALPSLHMKFAKMYALWRAALLLTNYKKNCSTRRQTLVMFSNILWYNDGALQPVWMHSLYRAQIKLLYCTSRQTCKAPGRSYWALKERPHRFLTYM